MKAVSVFTSLVAAVLLTLLFLPRTFRYICRAIGSTIHSRTDARRTLLLERARRDEHELAAKGIGQTTSQSDGDWEKIESASIPSSGNGEKAGREWEGVIGFFHPFWSAAAK